MRGMIAGLILSALLASGCVGEAVEGDTVEITPEGFSPATLKVKAGGTVTFVNKDKEPHWPASGMHPTHTHYPEGGGCIGSAFDACRGLAEGESYSFTFKERGAWDYHDHLNSGMRGTIIVE